MFRDILENVKPIKMTEPLAATLGAFKKEDAVLDYTFTDVVKMAGHACPTVAGAYVACQLALEKLYPEKLPVRGDISVIVYGEPDDGVYGVISQAISYLTGSAPLTGFKGLGHKFKRKDLLKFRPDKTAHSSMSFEFKRLDNGKTVLVKLDPSKVPFSFDKQRKIGELLEKVIWDAATTKEKELFQDLWIEKVAIILNRIGIDNWLQLEERRNA